MSHNKHQNTYEQNHSDSDDWTLVSPPQSLSPSDSISSGPESDQLDDVQSGSANQDDLTEIDLNETELKTACPNRSISPINQIIPSNCSTFLDSDEDCCSSPELIPAGFHPVDSTSDEDDRHSSREFSRRSSLTQSELGEYVDLGQQRFEPIEQASQLNIAQNVEEIRKSANLTPENLEQAQIQATTLVKSPRIDQFSSERSGLEQARSSSLRAKLDELNEAAGILLVNQGRRRQHRDQTDPNHVRRPLTRRWLALHLLVLLVHIGAKHLLNNHNSISHDHDKQGGDNHRSEPAVEKHGIPSKKIYHTSEGSVPIDSSRELDLELNALHDDLSDCIKRQSPTAYKYRLTDNERVNPNIHQSDKPKRRPYRGWVCYGQETHLRKRLELIFKKYNLDLKKLMDDAKRKVTNEMLEIYHPTLKLKLILNQIDYFDWLDAKRTANQYEETIRHLKRENLRLSRLIGSQPNKSDLADKKLIASLELENAHFKLQIETLKGSLSNKAGPTYIRQSQELERYENENKVLKDFHLEFTRGIINNLKLFQLHTVESFASIDDHQSLYSHLSSTKAYLRRLNEKIGSMLNENEGLKEELRDVTNELLTVTAPEPSALARTPIHEQQKQVLNELTEKLPFNLGTTNELESLCDMNEKYHGFGQNNSISSALIADGCLRELKETRDELNFLVAEMARLRRDCASRLDHKTFGSPVQTATNRDLSQQVRNSPGGPEMNVSSNKSKPMAIANGGVTKRISSSLSKPNEETAIDKLSVSSEVECNLNNKLSGDLVDDMMAFLTRFTDQVEFDQRELALIQPELRHQLGLESVNSHRESSSKVLPNYIREAIRGKTSRPTNTILSRFELPSQQSYLTSILNTSQVKAAYESEIYTSAKGSPGSSRTEPPTAEKSEKSFQDLEKQNLSYWSGQKRYAFSGAKPDSWFIKRAKQRNQLRHMKPMFMSREAPEVTNRDETELSKGPSTSPDWMLKRAKLREKLRMASFYIEDNYIASNYMARRGSIRSQDELLDNCKQHTSSETRGRKGKKHEIRERCYQKQQHDDSLPRRSGKLTTSCERRPNCKLDRADRSKKRRRARSNHSSRVEL